MMQKVLSKAQFPSFIEGLLKSYEVYGPVKDKNTKFQKIGSSKELYLDTVTEIPAKNIFLPEHEVIVEFKGGKASERQGDTKKRVIFGLRTCDLNALQILDKVMFDPLYLTKRKNTVTIGLFCEHPDEFCFCNSMELVNYYDLFFYPQKNEYYISVGSAKGLALVKGLPTAKKEVKIPHPLNTKVLEEKNIEKSYRNKIWEADAEKCLSCSACTVDCPTCNCFDIKDQLEMNLKDGKRSRCHMSCQLKSFTRVAGGKSYRDARLSRFKHFVYHKLVYYHKHQGRYMCVGCGRCLRVCPTKIDWVKTINLLDSMETIKKKGGKKKE